MTLNYIEAIKELSNVKVHIKNKELVNNILKNIISDGKDKLQVISDFDRTITKQHHNGQLYISSFGIFARCPSTTSEYLRQAKMLLEKYHPIEVDPKVPDSEKIIIMEKWWSKISELIKGEIVSKEEIAQTIINIGPPLRNGTVQLFSDLNRGNIPVLVFSAGLGDTLLAILKQNNILLPNVKVVSNFLYYNEDGIIQGFKNYPLIHVLNKNAVQDEKYLMSVKDRKNVLLMGDSLGDATMAGGVHADNILKIGFLFEEVDDCLPSFMDAFDIVLIDDQTMTVPQAILKFLFERY